MGISLLLLTILIHILISVLTADLIIHFYRLMLPIKFP